MSVIQPVNRGIRRAIRRSVVAGAVPVTADQILTSGKDVVKTVTEWGFNASIPIGALVPADTIWQPTSDTITVIRISHIDVSNTLVLEVTGSSGLDEDWIRYEVNGVPILRTAATFQSAGLWTLVINNPIIEIIGASNTVNWFV